jgi:hypothetical protein
MKGDQEYLIRAVKSQANDYILSAYSLAEAVKKFECMSDNEKFMAKQNAPDNPSEASFEIIYIKCIG